MRAVSGRVGFLMIVLDRNSDDKIVLASASVAGSFRNHRDER